MGFYYFKIPIIHEEKSTIDSKAIEYIGRNGTPRGISLGHAFFFSRSNRVSPVDNAKLDKLYLSNHANLKAIADPDLKRIRAPVSHRRRQNWKVVIRTRTPRIHLTHQFQRFFASHF